jgi:hypothetical protein
VPLQTLIALIGENGRRSFEGRPSEHTTTVQSDMVYGPDRNEEVNGPDYGGPRVVLTCGGRKQSSGKTTTRQRRARVTLRTVEGRRILVVAVVGCPTHRRAEMVVLSRGLPVLRKRRLGSMGQMGQRRRQNDPPLPRHIRRRWKIPRQGNEGAGA